MDDFSFDCPGLANYERMLLMMGTAGARKAGTAAMKASGPVMVSAVKQKAPKRTGLLRRSIWLRSQGVQGDNIIFSVDIRKIAFYARFLEYGTSKMSPKPFMRPAAAEATQTYVVKLTVELGRNIQALWGMRV